MMDSSQSEKLTLGPHPIPDAAVASESVTEPMSSDWNPQDPQVLRDAVTAYDKMRSQCPVARDATGNWTLFSHAEVTGAALDHETFSNEVSHHLQVPNGLDGPAHTAFRGLVDRYFSQEQMAALEPAMRQVAADLVAQLHVPARIDAVDVGSRYAVRAQCTWLGWPAALEDDLVQWIKDNHRLARTGSRSGATEVARRFDAIVRPLAFARREAGADAPDDVTTELVRDRVDGRELMDEEIVSILRNWTGGDLGSIALCIGVILTYLADHPDLQTHLRSEASDREFNKILDEILRIDDPFVANRRIATKSLTVGGREFATGDVVTLNWTAANRDPQMFGNPDTFDPPGNAPYNLVYGIGKHVCPGRPLATLELRAFTRAVLDATTAIAPDLARVRERELPPLGGFAKAPLHLR